jgi:carbonic anhydrase/acetyltransferase-like protein (isoleucine patch superfamily)
MSQSPIRNPTSAIRPIAILNRSILNPQFHKVYTQQMSLRPYLGKLPVVAPGAFVDETAQVIGDVVIGAESSVWMQVVIRGDVNYIRVGDRTNVQDGTVVHVQHDTHPTVIGNDVTIGHGAVVHGCTIHDRVLIGMGAIILNGAVIGEDSIVAAGTLVTERTVIPPRSMVMGSPGKVRRPLTDAEVATILEFSGNYVRYRLDYMG